MSTTPPSIKDAKDVLVHHGKDHLHRAPVQDWQPPATINGATQQPTQKPALKPLTFRSIVEIMAYQPDENDLILSDGYLCKGNAPHG